MFSTMAERNRSKLARRANQKSIAALAQRIVSLLVMPIPTHAVIGPVSCMI
jgi:hypothetical protein